MKQYKKIVAVALTLCMVSGFTACSSNNDTTNDNIDNDGDGVVDEIGEDLKDGAEDVVDDVENIGEDVKDGAEDLVDGTDREADDFNDADEDNMNDADRDDNNR